MALRYVLVLKPLGDLQGVFIGQGNDHFLKELNLLDNLDEFTDLASSSVLRWQFYKGLNCLLKIILCMKLVRQFLSQVVTCHKIDSKIPLDGLKLMLFLAQVSLLSADGLL